MEIKLTDINPFVRAAETQPAMLESENLRVALDNRLFFVLSGAELQLNVLGDLNNLLIGVVYIVCRCFGKYLGAWSGSTLMKCEPQVQKHLGITLFPQAGVALGMSLSALNAFPEKEGLMIRNIVLFGVLVYELTGPMLTKRSLLAAGEIEPEKRKSARGNI